MMSRIWYPAHTATAFGAADASCFDSVRRHDEKYVTRTFNLLQLNINGTQKKKDELEALLVENDIHIACLQETKLNENLRFDMKNYATLRKDRVGRTGGGLAILLKRDLIKYKEVKTEQKGSTEIQAIEVFLPGQSFTLINVYHPDNSDIDIESLCDIPLDPSDFVIMLGDFNAKSPTWGSHVLDEKGKQMEDLLTDLDLLTLNDGQSTYLSRTSGTQSAIDLTAVSPHIHDGCTWRVINHALSDHKPIVTTCRFSAEKPLQLKRSWNFRKANWPGFTEHLEKLCEKEDLSNSLENQINNFTCHINVSAKQFIPRGKRKQNWVPYWKNQDIDSLIKERDLLNEQLETNNTPEIRNRLSEASKKVEEAIATNKQQKWAEFCETLDPNKDTKFWKITKVLNNTLNSCVSQSSNVLKSFGVPADTNIKVANELASHFSSVSKIEYQKEDKKIKRSATKILRDARRQKNEDSFIKEITMEELLEAVNYIKNNKSPGIDLIFGEMIKHLGDNARRLLLNIFNTSWRSGRLPKIWKTSIIVPILKPGKSATESKNFRPIALTSILCKLMERIIHHRMVGFLMQKNVINFYQTAYRKLHSTQDQLFYFCQSVINGFQERLPKKTTAIFLDMSAAFDRVWRQKLITLIYDYGIGGRALTWINDFLRRRRIKVRYNGCLSKCTNIFAGVPQGSVLSPLLFLLYVNDIHPHLENGTKVACYADDIAIWHTDRDIDRSEKALQKSLNRIVKWTQDLKLKINAEKTYFSVFSTDRKHRKTFDPNLNIEGKRIVKASNPKYLGITLDAELRFTEHVKTVSERALKKLKIVRSLCGTDWGASVKTLKTTYTSLIRPIMEYASPIWAHASDTALNKLESTQARAAKIITGAVSSTNNGKIIRECGLESLQNRRKVNMIKFTNKTCSLPPEHISRIAFREWNDRSRLKRSSPMQYDKDIRANVGLEHNKWAIVQEPIFFNKLPMNTRVLIDLLEPCSKNEQKDIIRKKGLNAIEQFSKEEFVHAYTDGSSDKTITNGGAGVFLTTSDDVSHQGKYGAGKIASNFTCELRAVLEALKLYKALPTSKQAKGLVIFCDSKAALQAILKGHSSITQEIIASLQELQSTNKTCILQWIPAHVDIKDNETVDKLAKEGRDLNTGCKDVYLQDANAVARYRLREKSIQSKHLLSEINANRSTIKTITRLRTEHHRGMKINGEGKKIYRSCDHCPDSQLTPNHIYECPAMSAGLRRIGVLPTMIDPYGENIGQIAEEIIKIHGYI